MRGGGGGFFFFFFFFFLMIGNGNWEGFADLSVVKHRGWGRRQNLREHCELFILLSSQDERYINIVKIEDKPGQCPVGMVFMFYKKLWEGGLLGGHIVMMKGVFQKPRAPGFVQIAWKGKGVRLGLSI